MRQLVALLLTFILFPLAQADENVIGYVKNVSGNATVENAGTVILAQPGTPIRMNNILRTGARSSMGVTFKDNTLMSFGPNSETAVDEYLYAPGKVETKLTTKITKGTLDYVSGIIAKLKPEAVAVRTPTGTIGVRGTHFLAKVEGPPALAKKGRETPPAASGPAMAETEQSGIPPNSTYFLVWWERAEAELSGLPRATRASVPMPPDSYVVLLRNHDGTAGRIYFTGQDNRSTAIDQPGFGVMMETGNKGAFRVDQNRLDGDFREAMLALPKLPVSLMLYYRSGGTQLTADSDARIKEVLREVETRPAPEISIIGHTDTVGMPENNEALGLQRAQSVASVINAAGLNVHDLTVTSHGEQNPLVSTPDNTPEPRNRRVEVTVR